MMNKSHMWKMNGVDLLWENNMNEIEVVCVSMQCFKVDAATLEPVGGSYYEPNAWNDPRGPQMTHSEWCRLQNEQRDNYFREYYLKKTI
jgi:hypothetical protein